MPNWKIAILLLLNVTLIFGGEEENVSVRVDQGLLKGKTMVSRIGRKYYGFFKVPYAKPPLGELRFKVRDRQLEITF